jgi:hypothetical protein
MLQQKSEQETIFGVRSGDLTQFSESHFYPVQIGKLPYRVGTQAPYRQNMDLPVMSTFGSLGTFRQKINKRRVLQHLSRIT